MCVMYMSFGSKERPRTFGCVAMGSAVLFILRSRLFFYSAGSKRHSLQAVERLQRIKTAVQIVSKTPPL